MDRTGVMNDNRMPSGGTRGRVALIGARAARGLDEDMAPLSAALSERGIEHEIVEWDDPQVHWASYELALLRSTWDYTQRLQEFRDWLKRVAAETRLHNPPELVAWNTDKHYLGELAALGIPIVPSEFIEPGEDAGAGVAGFLDRHECAEFVAKPTVGAGSRGARRLARASAVEAVHHVSTLLQTGQSVLLQPYLAGVDRDGETSLLYFNGRFSHAIRKGPLLRRDEEPTRALFAREHITSRVAAEKELWVGAQVLDALRTAGRCPGSPLYVRVDLLRDGQGKSCVLELEVAEPSLFLGFAAGAAARFAAAIAQRLEQVAAHPVR